MDPAATGTAGTGGSGAAGGGKENGGKGAELVYPALNRQSTPKGEPLCCKQLAQMPLCQVMVVRAGVVTLCAEGLLKLWARPSTPPPLPPLPEGGTCLARKKVREGKGGRSVHAARPVRRCAGVVGADFAGSFVCRMLSRVFLKYPWGFRLVLLTCGFGHLLELFGCGRGCCCLAGKKHFFCFCENRLMSSRGGLPFPS